MEVEARWAPTQTSLLARERIGWTILNPWFHNRLFNTSYYHSTLFFELLFNVRAASDAWSVAPHCKKMEWSCVRSGKLLPLIILKRASPPRILSRVSEMPVWVRPCSPLRYLFFLPGLRTTRAGTSFSYSSNTEAKFGSFEASKRMKLKVMPRSTFAEK